VRQAIRDEQKLAIGYRDEKGRATKRTIRPVALIYYSDAANIVAWCELRQALRHFRTSRVEDSALVDEFFRGEGDALRKEWVAGWRTN
jgi:predicted DNA-binding transcriptional regulator YafY